MALLQHNNEHPLLQQHRSLVTTLYLAAPYMVDKHLVGFIVMNLVPETEGLGAWRALHTRID